MKKCCGIFGWLFGHSFEANYDKEWAPTRTTADAVNALINGESTLLSKTYVNSVCSRCGQVLTKNHEP